ncbi:MAG: coproporphyrinogen-III oxidase family protein [Coriobacteriia bacterium]
MDSQSGGLVTPWSDARVPLPKHLYVHVPVCHSRCAYCDFFTTVESDAPDHAALVGHTVALLRGWFSPVVRWSALETLYIGGGTPTVLGPHLVQLVRSLTSLIPLATGAEVTVEANPESFTPALATALAAEGVTRVSIGVQSLDDVALASLGRCHDSAAALEALAAGVQAGLDVSADLICGVPGVSPEAWERSLRGVVDAGVSHVSVYPLTVEAGTPLARAIAAGEVSAPDEDAVVDGMNAAAQILSELGFDRYEVANYARPGHRSVHNTAYWTGKPYIGIGGGAHGMVNAAQARAVGLAPEEGGDIGRVRYAYAAHVLPGDQPQPLTSIESLTVAEAAREDAMLAMRMSDGIGEELAVRAAVLPALESLVADGLVIFGGGRWRPTERGWLFGNEVFSRIWGVVG